jgi:hypothetical protein
MRLSPALKRNPFIPRRLLQVVISFSQRVKFRYVPLMRGGVDLVGFSRVFLDSNRFRHHFEVNLLFVEIILRHMPRQRKPGGDQLGLDGLAVDLKAKVSPGHRSELVLLEGEASNARQRSSVLPL